MPKVPMYLENKSKDWSNGVLHHNKDQLANMVEKKDHKNAVIPLASGQGEL